MLTNLLHRGTLETSSGAGGWATLSQNKHDFIYE